MKWRALEDEREKREDDVKLKGGKMEGRERREWWGWDLVWRDGNQYNIKDFCVRL